ncbi:aldo/keto reductase [Massilia sp. MB5]|uniref:aldo/keto reductase n=1 Tax=Massilia sp. MB5 TaxID=2919578 RepID=UPI001F110C41|nr:aldo/keto reductase [Massilia sp. MB5]UMR29355.1 aldo/keto reductase [Massilia sp. MB5]
MKMRKLGQQGLEVSAIGLGCMGMSFAYGPSNEAEALSTLDRALELGVSHWDTAEVYGPYTNEELLGRALKGRRDKVTLATKFGFGILPHGEGMARMSGLNSRPEHVRAATEGSLRRLGVETIDLLYQHRVDPQVPIEDTVGAMAELVREGKVRYLGLSEVGGATLRRAHAVHPIAAVQSEYSLWSRDVEQDVLPVCRELGVGFVPYSPLGRGFLTGKLEDVSQLSADDFRHYLPRFQQAALQRNRRLLQTLTELAHARQATPAQLALAWLLAQGEDIAPIPGARRIVHLQENSAAVELALSAQELDTIAAAFTPDRVDGARYSPDGMALVGR